MSKTGKLGNPLEYFSPHVPFEGAETYQDRCNIALSMGKSDNGVVAVKFFAHHIDIISKVGIQLDNIFPERYWIWLRRRNLLDQAISRVIALQTDSWEITNEQKKQPYYSSKMIMRALGYLSRSEARWRVFFARNHITPLLLWYEDFIIASEDTILKIADFAGINIQPSDIKIDVHTKIQRTELNEEWKEKFILEMQDINHLDILPAVKSYPRSLKYLLKFIKGKLPSPG